MTQKDRWNARAARYEALAALASNKADALASPQGPHERDTAFLTQPGRIAARDRMHDRLRRSCDVHQKAEGYAAKAANLRIMAARNKGDAERGRAVIRASTEIAVGSLTDSIWGRRVVVKVNAKTVRLEGVSCPVDRAHLRVLA